MLELNGVHFLFYVKLILIKWEIYIISKIYLIASIFLDFFLTYISNYDTIFKSHKTNMHL